MDIQNVKKMNVSKTLLDQLYNKELKERFLQNYLEEDPTRVSYAIFLIQAAKWENKLNKDLCQFSRENCLDMLSDNFTDSYSSLRAFFTICSLYVGYCTLEGFNKSLINPFKLLKFNQHVMPMLNSKYLPFKYVSEEQMWAMEDESINYQDFAIIVMSYFSIKGTKLSEMCRLKEEDINGIENTVILTDEDGSKREIKLPQRVIDILNKANGEDVYNRRGKEGFGSRVTALLKEGSPYILKPTTVNGTDFLSPQSCAMRAKKLFIDCGYPNLSIGDIYMASKLNALKKIELAKPQGEFLTVEDFKKIQFDYNDNVQNYNNTMVVYNLVNPKAE